MELAQMVEAIASPRGKTLPDLSHFYGTEHYYRWSILFRRAVLTDGAKYLAETVGAYWLMDAIASHIFVGRKRRRFAEEGFVHVKFRVWSPEKDGKPPTLLLEDGNGKVIARQEIIYTDFPEPGIDLYAVLGDGQWVIMLPSEY